MRYHVSYVHFLYRLKSINLAYNQNRDAFYSNVNHLNFICLLKQVLYRGHNHLFDMVFAYFVLS